MREGFANESNSKVIKKILDRQRSSILTAFKSCNHYRFLFPPGIMVSVVFQYFCLRFWKRSAKFLIALSFLVPAAIAGDCMHSTYNRTIKPLKALILNGEISLPRQLPYQVGLSIFKRREKPVSWCGGALISSNWILTAAHCTYETERMTAYVGYTDRYSDGIEIYRNHRKISISKENIVAHEEFNHRNLQNDIAAIHLTIKIDSMYYIHPAKLPLKGSSYTYENETVWISGWGSTKEYGSPLSSVLRHIKLPIISNSRCEKLFEDWIQESNICGDTMGEYSTCSGDSGGPVVLKDGGIDYLIGIVSFGEAECNNQYPVVFTRITSYLDWIESVTSVVNK